MEYKDDWKPYYYHVQYHHPNKKKLLKSAWILDVSKLFTHKIMANE